jgi:hypothetical protein
MKVPTQISMEQENLNNFIRKFEKRTHYYDKSYQSGAVLHETHCPMVW